MSEKELFATKKNTELGETVLVPIEGEWMHDEQICEKYELVLALKSKNSSELVEFHDELAYKFHDDY